MSNYRRHSDRVSAWKVPLWGRVADEDLPSWLVDYLNDEVISINYLGGFTNNSHAGWDGCAAGDYIIRNEDGKIEFCSEIEFAGRFVPLSVAA